MAPRVEPKRRVVTYRLIASARALAWLEIDNNGRMVAQLVAKRVASIADTERSEIWTCEHEVESARSTERDMRNGEGSRRTFSADLVEFQRTIFEVPPEYVAQLVRCTTRVVQ